VKGELADICRIRYRTSSSHLAEVRIS